MALVLICYNPYKGHALSIPNAARLKEKGYLCEAHRCGCLSLVLRDTCNQHTPCPVDLLIKPKLRRVNGDGGMVGGGASLHCQIMTEVPVMQRVYNTESHLRSILEHVSSKENLHWILYAAESSTNEQQLRSLDSYFGKLPANLNQPSEDSSNWRTKPPNKSLDIKAKEELKSLDAYLGKLNKDANTKDDVSSAFDDQNTEGNPIGTLLSYDRTSSTRKEKKLKTSRALRSKDGKSGTESSQALQQCDETSDLYLISILASINIAVVLFEIASPVKNADFQLFSLPLLYGAKINQLILVGEWWRLVTPMFLHSGFLHVALGCWSLLTFGPQVCRAYGSFTFFLIYVLGGISGNMISFLHTPALTVGGTGPVFALIGAWFIDQILNRGITEKDVSERMLQKAVVTTALSCILSNFGPIDDWTHFGAAFTGMMYGFFTCPMLQLDNASSRTGGEKGITVVRRYADPCKSLVLFTTFILVLGSSLFMIEPPLDMPDKFL